MSKKAVTIIDHDVSDRVQSPGERGPRERVCLPGAECPALEGLKFGPNQVALVAMYTPRLKYAKASRQAVLDRLRYNCSSQLRVSRPRGNGAPAGTTVSIAIHSDGDMPKRSRNRRLKLEAS